jgi:hypothetical protein
MSRLRRAKLEKRKRREKKLKRERNLRRNRPSILEEGNEELDIDLALEALPTELQMERVMRRVALAAGRRRFTSGAEVLAEIDGFSRPGNEAAAAAFEREEPRESAQDLAYLALDRENAPFSRDLVHRALELDPECVDALAMSALYDGADSEARLEALEHAVATGERVLGGAAFFEQNRGYFWTDVLTRPYMRARRVLANARIAHGEDEIATAHLEALLEFDPEDRLDVRDQLLGFVLARGDVVRARELIERSAIARSPVATWARSLERWLSGDRKAAASAVRAGSGKNAYVGRELMDSTSFASREIEVDENLGAIETEGERIAELVGVRLRRAWHAHPAALEWLSDGAPSTTEEERRATIDSFSPRLSKFFELGALDHGDEWVDYRTTFALTGDDASELTRMATELALHEQPEPAAWAPMHAWRALSQMQAASAARPLLDLALDLREDDWLLGDLPRVLASLGASSFDDVVGWMKEHAEDELAWLIAHEAIPRIASEHPDLRPRALELLGSELARALERDRERPERDGERTERDGARTERDRERPERNRERNGWLVAAAVDLRAVELAPQIHDAFEADVIDPTIAGDWKLVRAALKASENV